MTVAAGFMINGYPVLIADLLISALSDRATEVPTIEDISDVLPNYIGLKPVDLRQKIAIVSDNLMVAWADRYIEAKTVIKEMVDLSRPYPFTRDSLREYLKTIDKSILRKAGFLGFLLDENTIYPFGLGRGYSSLHLEKLGKIGLMGSGRHDFESAIKQTVENYKVNAKAESDSEFSEAIAVSLNMLGSLLMIEVASGRPLYQFYGGGYELASVIEGKFQKIGNITYLFWSASIDGKTIFIKPSPYNVIKNYYFNDILVVLSVITEDSVGDKWLIKKQTADVIPPIYRDINKEEYKSLSLSLPSINSEWICNYFLVKTPDGEPKIFAQIDHNPEESIVHFKERGQEITGLTIKTSFIESVGQKIFSHLVDQ